MHTITRENLPEFTPVYPPYDERLQQFAAFIGQDNPVPSQEHGKFLRRWNETSAIGFSDAELDILELIYSVDCGNARFDQDRFVHTGHGGNTAAHPIFMGLAFDRFRDVAKLGAADFDSAAPESLELAKLCQRVHGMIAVHDVGEVVDVSFAEQRATGASFKEPEQEALVAPFKFKLAAYALSIGDPQLYVDITTSLKADALKKKNELYNKALDGEITGDEFVRGFGEVIGQKIDEAEKRIDQRAIKEEYRQAANTLDELFDEAEKKETAAGQLLGLVDKYEGAAHYAYFAGKAAKEHMPGVQEEDSERRMYNRLFGAGDNLSYVLAGSTDILSQLKYSQKPIPAAFAAAEAEPEATREITHRLTGAAAGGILRSCIALMQKSAPFVDFNAKAADDIPITPTAQPEEQAERFATRLDH